MVKRAVASTSFCSIWGKYSRPFPLVAYALVAAGGSRPHGLSRGRREKKPRTIAGGEGAGRREILDATGYRERSGGPETRSPPQYHRGPRRWRSMMARQPSPTDGGNYSPASRLIVRCGEAGCPVRLRRCGSDSSLEYVADVCAMSKLGMQCPETGYLRRRHSWSACLRRCRAEGHQPAGPGGPCPVQNSRDVCSRFRRDSAGVHRIMTAEDPARFR